MDFDRFAKVMALLDTDNDGEALAAARSLRRISVRAGVRLHDIALAARDGFAGSDDDELERLSEETRTLRREVRRLNALLRNSAPPTAAPPVPADASSSMSVRGDVGRLLKLQRENRELNNENERLLDLIGNLTEKIQGLEKEIRDKSDQIFIVSERLRVSEQVNKILVDQSDDLIKYLKY
jgi:hypothetical protein